MIHSSVKLIDVVTNGVDQFESNLTALAKTSKFCRTLSKVITCQHADPGLGIELQGTFKVDDFLANGLVMNYGITIGPSVPLTLHHIATSEESRKLVKHTLLSQ